MVESRGWDYFRTIRKKMIEEISKGGQFSHCTGRGVVLDPDNVVNLSKNGLILWLKQTERCFKKDKSGSATFASRPTLTGKGTIEELEEIMVFRILIMKGCKDSG